MTDAVDCESFLGLRLHDEDAVRTEAVRETQCFQCMHGDLVDRIERRLP